MGSHTLFSGVVAWCEVLLGRKIDVVQEVLGAIETFGPLTVMRCVALESRPSDEDVCLLGALVRRYAGWQGARRIEEGRRKCLPRLTSVKTSEGVYSFRCANEGWCVRVAKRSACEDDRQWLRYPSRRSLEGLESFYLIDVLLFPRDKRHQDLYAEIESIRGFDNLHYRVNLFRPMVSVMDVERAHHCCSAVLVLFEGGTAMEKMLSISTWLRLVTVMWGRVEPLTVEQWQRETSTHEFSNEDIMSSLMQGGFFSSVDGYPVHSPMVIVQRDSFGRHSKCFLAAVSQRRPFGGSVLLMSYVAFDTRVGLHNMVTQI